MTDLLREHYAIAKRLSIEDRAHFNDFFIGAVSNHVTEAKWRSCLETATRCLNALNPTPAATSDEQADKGGSDSPTSPHGADGSEGKS